MKLYLVIYMAGLIGGTVGPLPYGIEECHSRASEILAQLDQSVITPQGFTAKDVRLECEFHDTRPLLDDGAGKAEQRR